MEKEKMSYEQWKESIMSGINFTISPNLRRSLINSQRGLWVDDTHYTDVNVVKAKVLGRIHICDVAFREQQDLRSKKRKAAKLLKQYGIATA